MASKNICLSKLFKNTRLLNLKTMTVLKIIIDTRETGSVARELDILGTPYTIEHMPVGDFAIVDDSGMQLAVWERKTCADLAASINDGRYAEQKGRLLSLSCPWKGYIIEGYYPEKGIAFPKVGGKISVVPRLTIDSVKLGLVLRDRLSVFELADSKHTALFLVKMLDKLKQPEYTNTNTTGTTGVSTNYQEALIKSISTVRKENMTPEVCYLAQLCQVPGISHGIAQAIQSKYPNMRALLNAKDLAEIKCSESRRLGKVLAQRLVDFLGIGTEDEEDKHTSNTFNTNTNTNTFNQSTSNPSKHKPIISRRSLPLLLSDDE
jgi:ERCC4-type nuclease